MSHTPGPWFIKYGFTGLNGCRIVGAHDVHVATITRKADKPIDQKLTDARLIAAAPDLLAAIEQALDDMGDDGHSVCEYAKQMLRDAVAKAEPPHAPPEQQKGKSDAERS